MAFLNDHTHKCHLALSYRTHAVLLRGIKIDAVAFVQNHDLIADGDFKFSSQDKVKLLSCVRVLVVVRIARQRVDGHKERINLTSLKSTCKTLILIVFASFNAQTLAPTCKEIAFHAWLLAEEQHVKGNAIAFRYF